MAKNEIKDWKDSRFIKILRGIGWVILVLIILNFLVGVFDNSDKIDKSCVNNCISSNNNCIYNINWDYTEYIKSSNVLQCKNYLNLCINQCETA